MYYIREGLPEESEIVMCTVTKIQYSSVFVQVDDYNKPGMIHISEIAAGRIRNIRDYVKEDKKIVCKVLKIYRGQIDLSLRRVNESQRRNKVNQIKKEQKAEEIIDYVAKQNKMEPKKLYDSLMKKNEYQYLHQMFEDVITGTVDITKIVNSKIAPLLHELISTRFKPKAVSVSGVLELSTYASNGVEIIKEALKTDQKAIEIKYLGGGKYKVVSTAEDYKTAEHNLGTVVDTALQHIRKFQGTGEFHKS